MKYITIFLLLMSFCNTQIKFNHGLGLEIADKEDYLVREYGAENYKDAQVVFGNIVTIYQLRGNWKNIDVIFDNIIYTKLSGHSFAPVMGLFDSEVRYNISKLYSVSLAHRCVHPILTNKEYYDQVFGGYNIKVKLHYNIK